MTWTEELRKVCRKVTAEESDKLIEQFRKIQPNINGLEDIFKNADIRFNEKKGILEFKNDLPLSSFEKDLRFNGLESACRNANINIHITSAMESSFAKMRINFPEFKLKKYDDIKIKAKDTINDIDIVPSKSVEETKKLISKNSLSKIKKIGSKLKTILGASAVIVGIYVLFTLGSDFVNSLIEQAQSMSGCYKIVTNGKKTTACKLSTRSCKNNDGDNKCNNDTYLYNPISIIANAIHNNETEFKKYFKSNTSITKDDLEKNITDNYDKLVEYYKDNIRPNDNLFICVDNKLFETTMSNCRACDSTADTKSILYVDPSEFADNITLQCKPPGTILDALIDTVESTGNDLLAWLGSIFGIDGKTITYIIIGIISIIGIFYIIRFLSSKKNNSEIPMDTS